MNNAKKKKVRGGMINDHFCHTDYNELSHARMHVRNPEIIRKIIIFVREK